MLALQPTMGFSLLGDFLPSRPFTGTIYFTLFDTHRENFREI
jgi:hypothetical protein